MRAPFTAGFISLLICLCSLNASAQELPVTSREYSLEEIKLGRGFMRHALVQLDFAEDAQIVHYVENLGRRLLGGSGLNESLFQFLVVNDSHLNAFAVPGGFIALHTGLFERTETEGELASVVAHEIAHITQRHLPRMIERAEQRTVPAVAAMVAAILMGGQVGASALISANAAMAADQLKYNREFEKEADAVGLGLLDKAGFASNAMPAFFLKLHKSTELHASDIPEYLRTHPLSINRIADSEARAAQMPQNPDRSSMDYLLTKARVAALYSPQQERQADLFQDWKQQGGPKGTASRYGEALAAMATGQYERAQKAITSLIDDFPDEARYRLAQVEVEFAAGAKAQALENMSALYETDKNNVLFAEIYAEILIATRQFEKARTVLRRWQRADPKNARVQEMMSRVDGEMGRLAEAFMARAEYFALRFRLSAALAELEKAERHAGDNYYLRERISARKAVFQADQKRYDELPKLQ